MSVEDKSGKEFGKRWKLETSFGKTLIGGRPEETTTRPTVVR